MLHECAGLRLFEPVHTGVSIPRQQDVDIAVAVDVAMAEYSGRTRAGTRLLDLEVIGDDRDLPALRGVLPRGCLLYTSPSPRDRG